MTSLELVVLPGGRLVMGEVLADRALIQRSPHPLPRLREDGTIHDRLPSLR